MNDKLKPCPFCGGKPEKIVRDYNPACPDFGRTVKINCRCGISTHEVVYQDESDFRAIIDIWNRRANDEEKSGRAD